MNTVTELQQYSPGRPRPLFNIGFMEELERAWGGRNWGAQNHTGRLEMVMVHRPGEENESPELLEDPGFFNLPERAPDLRLMQQQHDAFCAALEKEGVEVVYLDPEPPYTGTYGLPLRALMYSRTATVIDGGAIIDRNANHYKRGMELFYVRRLAQLGCPILYTVHGTGSFESSDLVFVRPELAVLAKTARSNQEGLDQVAHILERNGVQEILWTDIPGYWTERSHQWGQSSGFFHLDAVFGMAAENVAVVYVGGVGYHLLEALNERGVEIVEVPDDEVRKLAANLLVIEPGKVVIPAGADRVSADLRAKGITVIELDFSEILAAGGGPKCITMPLVHR
jgi:N-dimethylarginine dimethylaminohydrolase